MQELRKHPRYETSIPAEATNEGKSVPVTVIEISTEGLRLQSRKFFSPDSIVSTTVMVGDHITFSGWVVWSLDAVISSGQAYHTGVRVDLITDAVNGVIAQADWEALIQSILRFKKVGKVV